MSIDRILFPNKPNGQIVFTVGTQKTDPKRPNFSTTRARNLLSESQIPVFFPK